MNPCRYRVLWADFIFRRLRYQCNLAERISGFSMIKVKARSNESVEQMMRRFKKMCEKEGLNRDIKRNSYYEKPSERKRRRQRKSLKRVTLD